MLDVYDTPVGSRVVTDVFKAITSVTNLQWQTWRKPRGVGMVNIVCIGSGAGASGGGAGIAGSVRNGGGGGGSSASTRVTVPAHLIPDTLYVQVGVGGAGLATAGTATAGMLSYVGIYPDIEPTNIIARSGLAGAIAATNHNFGGAGTAALLAGMPLATRGLFNMLAGQDGVIAGLGNNPGNGAAIGAFNTGGCSGGGATSADQAGGGFAGSGSAILQQSAVASAAGTGNPASSAPTGGPIFYNFGGCGGGSSNASPGSRGGDGAYGGGGGGGGAGTTSGGGGRGGDGIVIITSW